MNISLDMTQIIIYVLGLLGSAISVGVGKIILQYSAKLKSESKSKKLNNCIDIAAKLVTDTVAALNTTIVADIRKKYEDGKLTDEDKADILKNAVNTIFTTLSDDAKASLYTVYGDIPQWIQIQVENAVTAYKESQAKKAEYTTPVVGVNNVSLPVDDPDVANYNNGIDITVGLSDYLHKEVLKDEISLPESVTIDPAITIPTTETIDTSGDGYTYSDTTVQENPPSGTGTPVDG